MLKGKACTNCRRRKIKCDGDRPACSQCARSNGSFEDCEYPDGGPTQAQLLEERISHIQGRIHELENPNDITCVPLYFPYHPTDGASFDFALHIGSGNTAHGMVTNSPGVTHSPLSDSRTSPSNGTATLPHIQEPSPDIMQILVDAFYHHCFRFGFFLHVGRFRKSFFLPLPIGHHARPSAALINAVYLWGSHLSPPLAGAYREKDFLRNTLYHLSKDLSSAHPHRILHGIQAEVLLSYYYLKHGKVLEGNYHANAAVSLSLSSGLHRIRTPRALNPFADHPLPGISALSSPADGIEEGERIDAFWAVLILNNYWVAIQESHLMFYDLQNVGVDTPWPMDTTEYELHLLPQESSGTIRRFLENTSIEGLSTMALHAKAAVLLEQATVLRTHDSKGLLAQPDAFAHLDTLIDQFKSNFPLLDTLDSRPSAGETLLVTQMMAHVATIKLHLPFSDTNKHSRNKALFAAQSIANLTKNVMNTRSLHMDPIIGVLWTSACDVFMHEIPKPTGNFAQCSSLLQMILSQMTNFSTNNALMKFLVMRLRKSYSTVLSGWAHDTL